MRAVEIFENNLPENIRFYNNAHSAYSGQVDGTLWAYNPEKYPGGFDPSVNVGGVYGYLDWASYEGTTQIQMIEVAERYQRKGIATAMYRELEKESKEPIVWSGTTDPGEALRNAIQNQV